MIETLAYVTLVLIATEVIGMPFLFGQERKHTTYNAELWLKTLMSSMLISLLCLRVIGVI